MYAPARSSDPLSSHLAAEEIAVSGTQAAQQALTVTAVLSYPGSTSRELHDKTGLDRHALARRLSECERKGLVKRGVMRTCRSSNRPAVTWWGPDHVIQLGLLAA